MAPRRSALATSGDTTSTTTPSTSRAAPSRWTQVGTSSTAPAFTTTIDTTTLADGAYDVRAIAVDQFGNAASIVQSNVRVDNTAPSVVSSTPADGAVTASASSFALTASEDLASITQLKLDGAAAGFVPSLTGPSAAFVTGALADGNHSLTGWLHDAAGNLAVPPQPDDRERRPTEPPDTTRTSARASRRPLVGRRLDDGDDPGRTSAGGAAAGAGLPRPPHRSEPRRRRRSRATTIQLGSSIVDVRHDLGSRRHRRAPVRRARPDRPQRLDERHWARRSPLSPVAPGGHPAARDPGTLPGRLAGRLLVHRQCRAHPDAAPLALRDPDRPRQRRERGAARLRGRDRGRRPDLALGARYPGRLRTSCSTPTGCPIAQFGGEQFETKLGQITADDPRRFTLTEVNSLGIESAHTPVLRALPPLAGLSQAAARQALAARGFTAAASCSSAPGIPAGTVVGPTGVTCREEGSPSTSRSRRRPPAARSPCGSRSRRAFTARAARSPLACRSPIARVST